MEQKKMPWEDTPALEPTRIFGNLFFVGTRPASVHVIDTGEGLIMLDTGYAQSLPVVIDNMHRMGLDPHDLKYIFLTHGHIDHMGGARAFRDLSGAKIALGEADREYANGELDLSYAKELNMEFPDTFEADILLRDGDTITLGNTTVRAVATPGHTPGAMSFFFNVSDGEEEYIAGLHGGMGLNTLNREFLDRYELPYTLREDFARSMHRLNQEKVDISLGNHMQHNRTEGKAARLKAGDRLAFVDPTEWEPFNLRCAENLEKMIQKEKDARPAFRFFYRDRLCVFQRMAATRTENEWCFTLDEGVTVTLCKKDYPSFDAVEWVTYFENTSDTDSGIFSDVSDCHTLLPLDLPAPPRPGYMPKEGDACVIGMRGMVAGELYADNDRESAKEFEFYREYLDKAPDKTRRFENVFGRSSEGTMPFFDVTAKGAGYIAAIGWTGDWKAEFKRERSGVLMTSGLKETRFYLKPGEKLRTSSTLIMKYTADEDKHNKLRRLIKSHFSHKSCTAAERDGLLAFELWGGLTSEEMKKRIRELASHGIRFEDIWIDAGWYGQSERCDDAFSGDWGAYTGEWTPNLRVHPAGLSDVAACAEQAEMRLMLWFEPERARKGLPLTEEHPDWFLKNTRHRPKNAILNYGNEEARAYVLELLSDYVTRLNLSCYRQDFNFELSECFRESDEEDRRGISEIKHVMGMYRLWDDLHERFPHLLIDNCASGGRRIDIETLKRSIPFFRSDYQCAFNENPEVLQTHNANVCAYLPYVGCTSKTKSDTYAIRSAYASSFGGAFYNTVFQSMNEEDFTWAREIVEEYRSIRRYFCMDFHNHASRVLDDTSWAIWQYHDPEDQSGIVMAFRRSASPFDRVTVDLRGLLPNRTYRVQSLDDGSLRESTGSLEIVLPQKRSCTILRYSL